MKKILVILSGIFMIFCFLFINQESREQYLKMEINNEYLGDSLQFMVYGSGEKFTKEDIQYIVDLANTYEVSVVTNTGSTDILINQFLIINDERMFNRYNLDPSFNQSSNAILSTNVEVSTIGNILAYDESVTITKKPFFSNDNTRLDGWYFVYGEGKEAFYEEFHNYFPNDIEIVDLHGDDHDHEIEYFEDTNQEKLVKFGLLFSCSALIILLMFFTNKSREVSIKKMNGYSLLKIIKESMLKLTLGMIVLDLIIIILMLSLMIPQVSVVHIQLILNLKVVVITKYIALFFVYLIVLIYIKTVSISVLIKKKGISRFIMNINTLMRVAFVFVLSVSIFEMLPEFKSSLHMAIEYDQFINTCGNYAHGISVNRFLDEEENFKLYEFAYEMQKKSNYIGVSTNNYDNNFNLSHAWVDINYNYLKKFPIYDFRGQQIINLDEEKIYLLIPQEYMDDKELYEENVIKLKELFEFDEITIQDEQKIFTFNIKHNEGGVGYVSQIPILVSNDLSWDQLYFNTVDDSDFSKAPNPFESEREVTLNYEYATNEASFIFNNKIFSVLYEGTVILLYTGLLGLLIVQYLLSLFDVNRKEYMIKKMNGYTFFGRYIDIILLLTSSYVFDFLILKLFGYDSLVFIVLLVVMLFDALFTITIIRYIEKKSISIVLKGD